VTFGRAVFPRSSFRRKPESCASDGAKSEGCKSPRGRRLLPETEGNCVAARRGGEQPEVNHRSAG